MMSNLSAPVAIPCIPKAGGTVQGKVQSSSYKRLDSTESAGRHQTDQSGANKT